MAQARPQLFLRSDPRLLCCGPMPAGEARYAAFPWIAVDLARRSELEHVPPLLGPAAAAWHADANGSKAFSWALRSTVEFTAHPRAPVRLMGCFRQPVLRKLVGRPSLTDLSTKSFCNSALFCSAFCNRTGGL